MRTMAMLLAVLLVMMAVGTVEAKKKPTTDPTTQPGDQSPPTEIKRGITLADAERIAGSRAIAVGAPRNGVQVYRLMSRRIGTANSHPAVVVYMLNVDDNGIVIYVRK
jgi:hypothetical protein